MRAPQVADFCAAAWPVFTPPLTPNTFVRTPQPRDPNGGDKDHPHFYCNAAELVALFHAFELMSLTDREHRTPGSWHWHMLAERLA